MNIIYWIVKPFTILFLNVFYKIDFNGKENIPFGKPVVFAPNHVNAFIDAVLIGISVKYKVRFFARGDVFKGRLSRWILNQLNISPMYRIQEGYSELKKNDKTFEECRQLLVNDKALVIFPEGICIQERRLRPLKKGLARIVFQTAASINFNKDILIVPVGLNYNNPTKFRSTVIINYGNPISLNEFEQSYREDSIKTINTFTKLLEEQMKPRLNLINNSDNDELVSNLEELYLKKWIQNKNKSFNLKQQYIASKEIIAMVNKLTIENPLKLNLLKETTKNYLAKITQHQLRNHLLDPEVINKSTGFTFIYECIIIYFGMPIYGMGLLMNYFPYRYSKKYCDKNVKNKEFYASVYANLAMFLWLFYYAIQLLVVSFFRNWLLLGAYALLVPLTGYFVLYFYPIMKKIRGRWHLLKLVRKHKELITELVNERENIIFQIEDMMLQERLIVDTIK